MLAHVEPSAFSRTMSATTASGLTPLSYSLLFSGVLRDPRKAFHPGQNHTGLNLAPQAQGRSLAALGPVWSCDPDCEMIATSGG